MYLLAHAGITVGAAYTAEKAINWRRMAGTVPPASAPLRVDYRVILLGALLPDIIDKPLGLILLPGVLANGRTFLHTLLFLLLTLLAAVMIYRQQRKLWGFYVAFGVLMHFSLDAIWTDPVTFYWPLLGAFQTQPGITFLWVVQSWIQSFREEPRLYIPETAGFIILLFFTARLIIQKEVTAFMRQGRLC